MSKTKLSKTSQPDSWLKGIERIRSGHPELLIETMASVDSTQKQVKLNSVLIADEQTAGIGRHGNKWLTAAGRSICFSYRFSLPLAARVLTGYQLTTGLALVKTLKYFGCPHDKLLKWPNDLLLDGKKFAGILINLTPKQQQTQVTIGIGLNWNLTDDQLATVNQPICNVPLTLKPLRADFINKLVITINDYNRLFLAAGLKPFLQLWTQYDSLVGSRLQLIQGNRYFKGDYQGLNAQGELLLAENNQITSYGSGEVKVRAL